MADIASSPETLAQFREKRNADRAAALKARKDAEKAAGGKRSNRYTGRTTQFNFKAKPGWIDDVRSLAKARDVAMPEMLERILSEWKAARLPGTRNDYPTVRDE